MTSSGSAIYATETLPGHEEEASEGSYSQLTRQEVEDDGDSSDEEVITVRRIGPPPPAPTMAAQPTQPVKQSSMEDDNGWAELAQRDAPCMDKGYLDSNYLVGVETGD